MNDNKLLLKKQCNALKQRSMIDDVLNTLTPKEQHVIQLRFGLIDNTFPTLENIGKQFNLSRERIRQIQNKALRKLKHYSRSKKLKDNFNLEELNYLSEGYDKLLKSIIRRKSMLKTEKAGNDKPIKHRRVTSENIEISTYLGIAINNIDSTKCKKCNGMGWYLKMTLGNYFKRQECVCKEQKIVEKALSSDEICNDCRFWNDPIHPKHCRIGAKPNGVGYCNIKKMEEKK